MREKFPEIDQSNLQDKKETLGISSLGIKYRVSQILGSNEFATSKSQIEDSHSTGKYIVNTETAVINGYPVAVFKMHSRNGVKRLDDLGIIREWKIFGKLYSNNIALEMMEFESRDPAISVVNHDERIRTDLQDLSKDEQLKIAEVLKILS